MISFEDIKPGIVIQGLAGTSTVTVLHAVRLGEEAFEIAWRDVQGGLGERILFKGDLFDLMAVAPGRTWGFGADGALFQLVLSSLN
jgi:hypothetical protein